MSRMIRIFLRSIFLTAFILLCNSSVFANGPATVYKVRISKFEIYNGTSWITLFEGTSVVLDIAAVSAGSSAGTFLSGLAIPDGTYTQVRVTPSPTFTISGNDGTNYTTATAGPNGGCVPGTAAQQAEFTMTLTGGNVPTAQPEDFSATPITVTGGVANRKIRVSFDVSNAIQFNAGAGEVFPAQPTVTMTVVN